MGTSKHTEAETEFWDFDPQTSPWRTRRNKDKRGRKDHEEHRRPARKTACGDWDLTDNWDPQTID